MNGRPEEARPVGGEDCDADEMHTKGNGKSPTKDPTVNTDEAQPANSAQSDEEEPQSAILAPSTPGEFPGPNVQYLCGESVSDKSNVTVLKSPTPVDVTNGHPEKKNTASPVSPHALTTSMASPSDAWADDVTPRAQTASEVQRPKSKRPESLEGIPEDLDTDASREDDSEDAPGNSQSTKAELGALRAALPECWTLCNTLATLSCSHRRHLFNSRGRRNDKQEHAWKTCWKLCQNLYEHWDNESHRFEVKPTLELCREFCQALFEIRPRDNEVEDSVLRVSFELNNHLYNTHDRSLPEAFRERTLDFYNTLCHRLMKQRAGLTGETDSLLRACWTLAEMLFNLRQSKRDGRAADEELLGSAVQACWELCDLFRDGWTQVRPDRSLPRASQTTFAQAFYDARRRESTLGEDLAAAQANPETPTTVFEDTATVAADEASVPNIVVLGGSGSGDRDGGGGAGAGGAGHPKWSSSTSSTLSGYSSHSASSTHTIRSQAQTEDPNLASLKLLIVRAALNSGFQRNGPQSLPSFAKSLSSDSFGALPWQTSLLINYRKLVTGDPAFRVLPPPSRVNAVDVARSVEFMVQNSGQYLWLLDLYRWVFGFRTDEAVRRNSVAIQI